MSDKIILFIIAIVWGVISGYVGYKYGDSVGYNDGYNEGYRYDCKDEISLIYKRVKSQSLTIDAMNERVRSVVRENDSLKNIEKFKKYEKDRKAIKKQFEKDSVKYYKVVQAINDSLANVTGYKGIIAPNGRPNTGVCAGYAELKNLRECAVDFRVSLQK